MRRFTALLALVLLATGFQTADAQIQFGPRVGFDVGDAEGLMIGVDALLRPGSLPVAVAPFFDYYLIDEDDFFGNSLINDVDINVNVFNIGANALYEFGVDNEAFTPYAGAGLALTYSTIGGDDVPSFIDDSDTDVGLNLVGGSYFMLGGFEPYAQATIKLGGDFELFTVMLGLRFGGN